MMGSTLLFCIRCGSGYGSIGEIPPRCPACDRITTWTTSPPFPDPRRPYTLTFNDKKMLRSIKIQPD